VLHIYSLAADGVDENIKENDECPGLIWNLRIQLLYGFKIGAI
jgi:hypothetical protein